MFPLMLRCGLRICRVAKLRLSDLYLDEIYPRLVTCGKGSQERAVYLSPQAVLSRARTTWPRGPSAAERLRLPHLSAQAVHHPRHPHAPGALSRAERRLDHFSPAQAHLCERSAHARCAHHLASRSSWAIAGSRPPRSTCMANDRQVQADYFAACSKLEGWAYPQGRLSPRPVGATVAERYDISLRYARDDRLPPEAPRPLPTNCWPQGNVELLERFRSWLIEGGASEHTTNLIYVPIAGHVLGLNLKPHEQLNLEGDLEKALHTPGQAVRQGLAPARRQRVGQVPRGSCESSAAGQRSGRSRPSMSLCNTDGAAHLASERARSASSVSSSATGAQPDWSIATRGFWSAQLSVWRFLCEQRGVSRKLDRSTRQHVLDYLDQRLTPGTPSRG